MPASRPLATVRALLPLTQSAAPPRALGGPGPDAPPGAGGRRRRGGPPHVPARRRARAGQDRAGPARRRRAHRPTRCWRSCPNVVKTNWARRSACGPRTAPRRSSTATGTPSTGSRTSSIVELRGPRPPRRLARRPRLPRHGRRRGALHQEQVLAALAARAGDLRADPGPDRTPAAHGPDRHPADQRPRGLPGHLAVPGLDRRDQAGRRELMAALEETGLVPGDPGFYPTARRRVIDMGIVRRRKVDVAADIPARRVADLPVELDGEAGRSIRARRARARPAPGGALHRGAGPADVRAAVEGIDHDLVRRVATWERQEADKAEAGENVFAMMRRIGQAKSGLAADYTAQLARNVGKVVFFAKHVDVMDTAEELFAAARDPPRVDPRGPDREGPPAQHRCVHQRSGRRGRRVLPDGSRRGPEPPGRLEPGAGRAVAGRPRSRPRPSTESTASARSSR